MKGDEGGEMMKSKSNQGRVRSRCWEGVSERWWDVRGGGGVWYAGCLCGRRGGGWKVVVYGGETGYPRKDRGTEETEQGVRGRERSRKRSKIAKRIAQPPAQTADRLTAQQSAENLASHRMPTRTLGW